MNHQLKIYYGELCTDNSGTIIDIDEYCQHTFHLARKSDAIGRNIVHFIPDYSLDEFYIENHRYNIQQLHSKDLFAFSSYMVQHKKVRVRILIFKTELLNRFFHKIADGNITNEVAYFLSHAFSDQEHSRETLKRIKSTGVVGSSKELQALFDLIEKVADTDANLLLTGETGVGKSMFAKIIHDASSRSNNVFVEINCANIHDNLIESELFGYEEGAFTGANVGGKMGKIEMANNGTLFLDEITEMPLEMQQKFLEAIQHKRIARIGGTKYIDLDFRLITATNRDLEERVRQGKFREDLYYRINVIPMNIPPLRHRESDIISLVLHFARQNNGKYNLSKSFAKEVMQLFCRYSWPGNVRELENLVERMILTSAGDVIERKELPLYLQEIDLLSEKKSTSLKEALEFHEKNIILEAYSKYKTSVLVGEKLGISQTSAARKIRKYLRETN